MGLTDREMIEFRRQHGLRDDFPLPTIIDMPGLEPDEVVLKHILRGEVPPDTELKSCLTEQEELDLRLEYENAEERKVDRVIFVHALSKDVAYPFQKVLPVVRGVDGQSPCIPYYLVVTHIDRANDPRTNEQEENIKSLCGILSLDNNKTSFYAEVENYVDKENILDETSSFPTDQNKQKNGLKILIQVFQRQNVTQPPPIRQMTFEERLENATRSLSAFLDNFLRLMVYIMNLVITFVRVIAVIGIIGIIVFGIIIAIITNAVAWWKKN